MNSPSRVNIGDQSNSSGGNKQGTGYEWSGVIRVGTTGEERGEWVESRVNNLNPPECVTNLLIQPLITNSLSL